MNPVAQAVHDLGGFSKVARSIKNRRGKPLTPRAVRKWAEAGKLPRTEATGETNYAEQMAAMNPAVSKEALLATVYRVQPA